MSPNMENINSIVQKRSNLPLLLVNNYHWASFASNLKKTKLVRASSKIVMTALRFSEKKMAQYIMQIKMRFISEKVKLLMSTDKCLFLFYLSKT